MIAKSPMSGQWWRLVEIATGSALARYLTVQYEGYEVAPFEKDWASVYAELWAVFEPAMVLGSIGDSYGPWQPGRPCVLGGLSGDFRGTLPETEKGPRSK